LLRDNWLHVTNVDSGSESINCQAAVVKLLSRPQTAPRGSACDRCMAGDYLWVYAKWVLTGRHALHDAIALLNQIPLISRAQKQSPRSTQKATDNATHQAPRYANVPAPRQAE
jgi:hypothetical protein